MKNAENMTKMAVRLANGKSVDLYVPSDMLAKKRQALKSNASIGGRFEVECYDRDGNLKWTDNVHNVVTNEGLNAILNVMFHAATQITTWYVAIFESDTTPGSATTYAVPVFTESTAYDEATRPEYVVAAASGESITNSANKATFTINATKTIYGAALVGGGTDGNTKGDTAGGGTLYCAAKFTSSRNVEDDDTLQITYTIGMADDGV